MCISSFRACIVNWNSWQRAESLSITQYPPRLPKFSKKRRLCFIDFRSMSGRLHALLTVFSRCIDSIITLYWQYYHAVLTVLSRCIDSIVTLYWQYYHAVLSVLLRCIDSIMLYYTPCAWYGSLLQRRRIDSVGQRLYNTEVLSIHLVSFL